MYDVIAQVLGTGANPDVISATAGAITVLLTILFIDLITNIIRSFMRG